jgi:hypothetical protein
VKECDRYWCIEWGKWEWSLWRTKEWEFGDAINWINRITILIVVIPILGFVIVHYLYEPNLYKIGGLSIDLLSILNYLFCFHYANKVGRMIRMMFAVKCSRLGISHAVGVVIGHMTWQI